MINKLHKIVQNYKLMRANYSYKATRRDCLVVFLFKEFGEILSILRIVQSS